ncbi:TrmH family RNA methyltransferase [Acidisphaera sp. L21]|uniref:TrmH family RNA methyltransferase n=1 Tax=Acidisphaera sp. L21 TaxID=1641851 RepID=UPI00131AA087|nr:TrmH family RNA methyltransferase [Acidisphaera sp. L21]
MVPVTSDLNVRDALQGSTVEAIRVAQAAATLPFAIAAINLNGDLNIGVMMRTAVSFGAAHMFLFGQRRFDRRSTVGAHNYVDLVHIVCDLEGHAVPRPLFDVALAEHGYTPVFVEQGGTDLRTFDFRGVAAPPCLVFGNEGYGVPDSFIGGGQRISIVQRGVARSMNVSAAAAIACFVCSSQLE